MDIRIDDLTHPQVISLLQEHLDDMYATSPPECVHALDVEKLKAPQITFYSAWQNDTLFGVVALNEHDNVLGEIKSMRTTKAARNQGVASKLLSHLFAEATNRGYHRISLETGSQDYFIPARTLYEKHGFNYCGPFADYKDDPNSKFMTKEL